MLASSMSLDYPLLNLNLLISKLMFEKQNDGVGDFLLQSLVLPALKHPFLYDIF